MIPGRYLYITNSAKKVPIIKLAEVLCNLLLNKAIKWEHRTGLQLVSPAISEGEAQQQTAVLQRAFSSKEGLLKELQLDTIDKIAELLVDEDQKEHKTNIAQCIIPELIKEIKKLPETLKSPKTNAEECKYEMVLPLQSDVSCIESRRPELANNPERFRVVVDIGFMIKQKLVPYLDNLNGIDQNLLALIQRTLVNLPREVCEKLFGKYFTNIFNGHPKRPFSETASVSWNQNLFAVSAQVAVCLPVKLAHAQLIQKNLKAKDPIESTSIMDAPAASSLEGYVTEIQNRFDNDCIYRPSPPAYPSRGERRYRGARRVASPPFISSLRAITAYQPAKNDSDAKQDSALENYSAFAKPEHLEALMNITMYLSWDFVEECAAGYRFILLQLLSQITGVDDQCGRLVISFIEREDFNTRNLDEIIKLLTDQNTSDITPSSRPLFCATTVYLDTAGIPERMCHEMRYGTFWQKDTWKIPAEKYRDENTTALAAAPAAHCIGGPKVS